MPLVIPRKHGSDGSYIHYVSVGQSTTAHSLGGRFPVYYMCETRQGEIVMRLPELAKTPIGCSFRFYKCSTEKLSIAPGVDGAPIGDLQPGSRWICDSHVNANYFVELIPVKYTEPITKVAVVVWKFGASLGPWREEEQA
jgi:hypothetical protein